MQTKSIFSKRNILPFFLIVAMFLFFVSAVYVNDYYKPDDDAIKTFDVAVKDKNYYMFASPDKDAIDVVFYPGGKVDYRAYSSFAKNLSDNGFNVYVLKMPFHLSILSNNKADIIVDKTKRPFILIGHSLGGTSAGYYAEKSSENLLGIVFLGSYTTKDLSELNIPCLTFTGSADKIMNSTNYNKYKSNLPRDFTEIVIQGGNHSQFGNYGLQKGDGIAAITYEEQQGKIINELKNSTMKQ